METLSPWRHVQKSQEALPATPQTIPKGWDNRYSMEDNEQDWQSETSIAAENYCYEGPCSSPVWYVLPEEERRVVIKATSIKSGCSRTTMSRETRFVLQQWPERKKHFGSIGVEWWI